MTKMAPADGGSAVASSVINPATVDVTRFELAMKATRTASVPVAVDIFKRPLASMDAVRTAVEVHDMDRLKALLRANDWPVQHETRCGLWRLLAFGSAPQSDGVFREYAAKLFTASDASPTGAGGEVARTASASVMFGDEFRANYYLSGDGVRSVQRVLRVLGETNPHIREFTFLLYAFTSALLHYLPEEDCFDSVYSLLRRSKTDYFLAPSELSLHASAHVLRDLAFRYAKSAASGLERQWCGADCTDLATFCADWLLWIFKLLPFGYLVRVIDCYLVEGFKVLYRIALALMILYHKSSGKRTDFFDSTKADIGIKRFCEDIYKMVSIDKLLKTAFSIRGFTRSEITRLFAKNELLLRQAAANGSGSNSLGSRQQQQGGGGGTALQSAAAGSHSAVGGVSAGGKQLRSVDRSSRAAQRSFKFDHAIHSHVDLAALGSTILDKPSLARLWSWLPELQAVRDPVLVFTTNNHGYSIKRFYERCDGQGPTLLLIKTVRGEVFGAYCSADWYERQRSIGIGAQISYFGTGESFVFALGPEPRCHFWIGRTAAAAASEAGSGGMQQPPPMAATVDMFMAADGTMLTVGGGGGEALQVDENLNYGHSSCCATFSNLPLCSDGGQFQVQTLEAIAFR